MIFFKKKPVASSTSKEEARTSEASRAAASKAPTQKPKSFEDIVHTRVLTAEGWRRSMEKKVPKKTK